MEVALDFALQCSPDHPWVREHPEWFHIRPDGTIKYAENPPKKYQDIYPINFWCRDREGLWKACRDVLLYWVARGVKTFRVDNPHTKPFAFWEWVIAEVQSRHPDVIFFAEAFTRPKKLKNLAKLGFGQSYTYFTWKNTSYELREFVRELFNEDTLEYLRGNLFANTPDILHEYLQAGGKPAFRVRLLLAATMSPLYGLYSGYELYENVPVRHGSEEYLDSEKYQIRQRDWEAPGNLNPEIQRLNQVRRAHRALQRMDNMTIHATENEHIFFFRKAGTAGEGRGAKAANGGTNGRLASPVPRPSPQGIRDEDLLVIANLDPFRPQETMVIVPLDALGIAADEAFIVEDLLTGARYTWRGARNYVRLDPRDQPGHLFRVLRSATA
jgi:starch synthase (maltosyl-transferring)